MTISIEKKKNQAIKRLEMMVDKLRLSPSIRKYFYNDAVFYSYRVSDSILKIENLIFNSELQKIVYDFEVENEALVYHIIESYDSWVLLYVSDDETLWVNEVLDEKNYLMAHVVGFKNDSLGEFSRVEVKVISGLLTVI